MDPDKALNEIRELIKQYDELGMWKRDYDCNDAARILIDLAQTVAALDQWLTFGGFIPEAWVRCHGNQPREQWSS
ncbi:hypothetical protein [Nocardia sp. NBC_01327]|uniref:hypothetical protein n=1 Tax=Nocardia sp. NBC_01327 TaxID=2903593 RepID=UPI002E159F09|nr:hypothetical protein OG326_10155 [Nocardia sp. NBC_01327]